MAGSTNRTRKAGKRKRGTRGTRPSGLEGQLREAITLLAPRSRGGSTIDVDLPDLESDSVADIVVDNVFAVSAIYFAAQLEEAKFFAVADKVVEQFVSGTLPVSRLVGEALYRFWKNGPNRLTEADRRRTYGRVLGVAAGGDDPLPNRNFNDLWVRFLEAVSLLGRERFIPPLPRPRPAIADESRNARELAVDLSTRGRGVARFEAVELIAVVREVADFLFQVRAAYGAGDVWQLVERVSTLYLGGATNAVRHPTMAASGAEIIQWLARKGAALARNEPVAVDRALRDAVERWLSSAV